MQSDLSFADIDALTGGRIGTTDVPCPLCGPTARAAANRKRKTLRVWREHPTFAGFYCARCGAAGYAIDHHAVRPDPAVLDRMRRQAGAHCHEMVLQSQRTAAWLWRQRLPLAGSVAEMYLRDCRGYNGPLPPTLAFLPPTDQHPPAMIAALGLVREVGINEDGSSRYEIDGGEVRAVHLTKLKLDGSGKADCDEPKIIIGKGVALPIWLAPVTDSMGLLISEGIEDALSAHQALGIGAWAAGCASRLPAMAGLVPRWIESVTVLVDDDAAGKRGADALARSLTPHGIEARLANVAQLRGAP